MENFSFDYVQTKLKGLALSSSHRFNSSPPFNISKAEIMPLKNVGSNEDLVIIRPDNGNGTDFLNRSDFVSKVETSVEYRLQFLKSRFLRFLRFFQF